MKYFQKHPRILDNWIKLVFSLVLMFLFLGSGAPWWLWFIPLLIILSME